VSDLVETEWEDQRVKKKLMHDLEMNAAYNTQLLVDDGWVFDQNGIACLHKS